MSHEHEHDHGHAAHGAMHFSAERVFCFLFVLTMLEVGWGLAGKHFGWNRAMLWGGLLFFAGYKGWLIAVYFMHLKFEGWVVKSLVLPTPFLIMVIFGYVMPDVADKETRLIHPVGSEVDPSSGRVIVNMAEGWQPPHHASSGHGAAAEPSGSGEHAAPAASGSGQPHAEKP
jgi:cytochrome c oxidase subunit 4